MTTLRPTPSPLEDVFTADDLEGVSQRLLTSSAELSYDPEVDVDWDEPLDENLYGLNPEWSTLYGTALWEEMTQAQRIKLTWHEVASVMSTGIWLEMVLQQLLLRDQYTKDKSAAEFRYSLTEQADECRHSIMFSRTAEKLGATGYFPSRPILELGRVYKSLASGELAYTGILIAEEILDFMQRDWMRGEDVLPLVRTTSKIHLVEESRHMRFAREEIRQSLAQASRTRKWVSSVVLAIASDVILKSMISPDVYAAAGLDVARARREAAENPHRKMLMRTSSAQLMEFLDDVGLLTPAAGRIYHRNGML